MEDTVLAFAAFVLVVGIFALGVWLYGVGDGIDKCRTLLEKILCELERMD